MRPRVRKTAHMPNRARPFRALAALFVAVLCAQGAAAQLRVATWNITFYYTDTFGPRVDELRTAIYAEHEGRSMAPDVFVTQEFIDQNSADTFLTILNTAPNSPGDWAAAPFIQGPNTNSAFFYRESKIDFLGVTVVSVGAPSPHHPRNVQRYDVRFKGYDSPGATIAIYSTHMKAGSSTSDQQRRLVEAQVIRADAASLPEGWHFVLAGDLNIQRSTQAAYQHLVGSFDDDGRFFDPVNRPGTWNNQWAYRVFHTQDPFGLGGMDDRFDQILLSASLIDGAGAHYIGDPDIPHSLSTWDDPNHSYTAWGNDGTSFGQTLTTVGNTMVGEAIAQAIIDCAGNGGHIPVFLDLRAPAKVGSQETIDFGDVALDAVESRTLFVNNAADVALWTPGGLANLNYTLSAGAPFGVDAGPFFALPGETAHGHAVTLDAGAPGLFEATLEIHSDDPDEPVRLVALRANVVAETSCPGDLNGDGVVDSADLLLLLNAWGDCHAAPANCPADLNGDGVVDSADLLLLLGAWGTP